MQSTRNFRAVRVPIVVTMFRRGALHFAVACALVAPLPASAQEPARPDPDSPAGVEYQLPLDQARREASPNGGGGGGSEPPSGGGSGNPAPLFGAGISRDGSQSGGGSDATADPDAGERAGAEQSGDRADGGATGAGGSDAAGPGADQSTPSLRTASAESGGVSTGLTLGGIALAVVVVGGALGLALRRGLRTTPAR